MGFRCIVVFVAAAAAVTVVDPPPAGAGIGVGQRRCAAATAGRPGDLAVVNLTPVGASGPGNGQLVSSGVTTPPVASNVNFGPGTVDPNVAVAPIGSDGQVCFVNSANADVDIVLDQLLAFRADAFTPTATGAPERITDTRIGLNGVALQPNERRCMTAGTEAGALALVNLLPLDATAPGNGVLVPSGTTGRPSASNVNFRPGSVDPNLAVAVVGADRQVCFVNSEHATIDLVADFLGTVDAGAFNPTATGAPVRLIDTRSGQGGSRIAASEIRCVATALTPGDVAVVNLLPLNATAPGYGALGSATISNVNVAPGSIDPNLAFAPVDAQGRLCYVNSEHGTVDLVADLLATIHADTAVAPGPRGLLPARLVDTRLTNAGTQACFSARCYRVDGDNAVAVSNDGGRTWTDVAVRPARSLTAVHCVNGERCWVLDTFSIRATGTYITLDGGRTWTALPFELTPSDLQCPTRDVCMVVGTSIDVVFQPSRAAAITRDRGATWQWIPLPAAPSDLIGTRIDAVACNVSTCLARAVRVQALTLTTLAFTTSDGWQTVTVTEQ